MRFLLFLIIIIVIYFVATQIRIVQLDSSPDKKNQKESYQKSQIEKPPSKIPCHNVSKTRIIEGSARDLLRRIKNEYLDTEYHYNLSNQPSVTRYPSNDRYSKDRKYLKYIRDSINSWNEICDKRKKMFVQKLIPIIITETEDEFVITVRAKMIFCGKFLHLELSFHGIVLRSDDFDQDDSCEIQLVNIKPISRIIFDDTNQNPKEYNPFISMDQQLKYVAEMKHIHQNDDYRY